MTDPQPEPVDPEGPIDPRTWVEWNPETFVRLAEEGIDPLTMKPEAEPLTPEEIAAMDPEERRALEAGAILDWDAHVRRAHEAPPKKPLPRHRAPKFKDPGETVAPRLPANVFGAPRAIR